MAKAELKDRLREAMELNGMKQVDLINMGGFDKGQLSSWLSGKYRPRQESIDKLSRILGVSEAWLMGYDVPKGRAHQMHLAEIIEGDDRLVEDMKRKEKEADRVEREYYHSLESAEIAQELFDSPEMKVLFDAARDSKPANLLLAAEMLKRFKETNPDG